MPRPKREKKSCTQKQLKILDYGRAKMAYNYVTRENADNYGTFKTLVDHKGRVVRRITGRPANVREFLEDQLHN